jgi:DNA-binding PadR family transcriptional regulator
MSSPAYHVLLAMGTSAKHGYAIMQAAEEQSGGAVRILPGTLYATIKKLLADGLIEEVDAPKGADSDDARRRYYRVTKTGRQMAETETRRHATLAKMGRVFLK